MKKSLRYTGIQGEYTVQYIELSSPTCASPELHGVYSYVSWSRFSPLEKPSSPVSRAASRQVYVTHLSASLSGRGGPCLLQVVGGTVAGAHVSPHKHAGSAHCMEADSMICPAAGESSHFDSHRQQNSSTLHKPPRGCAHSSASQNSQTAITLGAHAVN